MWARGEVGVECKMPLLVNSSAAVPASCPFDRSGHAGAGRASQTRPAPSAVRSGSALLAGAIGAIAARLQLSSALRLIAV